MNEEELEEEEEEERGGEEGEEEERGGEAGVVETGEGDKKKKKWDCDTCTLVLNIRMHHDRVVLTLVFPRADGLSASWHR